MYQRDCLHRPQGERGFDLIWSIFIDDLINDSDLFYLKRGELESDSIKALPNRGRDVGVSLNNGPRFDGIKCLHSRMECGFMEVSTGDAPSFASKPLSESTKLVKGICRPLCMVAMLLRIRRNFEIIIRWLEFRSQVTPLSTLLASTESTGFTLRVSRMIAGQGMVMLHWPGAPIQLPTIYKLQPQSIPSGPARGHRVAG